MNAILSVFVTLGLFAASPVHASEASANCRRFVVVVRPENFKRAKDFAQALKLLNLPGLPIIDQATVSETGKMALISSTNQKVRKVIQALDQIEGVIVSCEQMIDPVTPRVVGTN